ncbi:hypothetical protein AYO47_06190 [Planctomyces sp. SCGC AG-212-M04]|nr:hypothetical protein AYO47_06190 [Planctomyces sp. SCGC AG-212-M04]
MLIVRNRFRVLVLMAAVALIASGAFVRAFPPVQTKTVRVKNDTADANIRVRCIGYGSEVAFTTDVTKGQFKDESGILIGSRGVVVYNSENQKILVTKGIELYADEFVAQMVVAGNANSGYTVAMSSLPNN